MNYQALYDFIHDIVKEIDQTSKVFHGRKEVLNLTDDFAGLNIWCLPFESTGTITDAGQVSEIWRVVIIFYQQDQEDSAIDQNNQDIIQDEIKTLTITDESANRFLHLLNENNINDSLEEAAEQLTIERFAKEQAIKDTAQLLTGTVLTISLRVPDNFDYCNDLTAKFV